MSSRPTEIFQPPQQGFLNPQCTCPVAASRKDFSAISYSPHHSRPVVGFKATKCIELFLAWEKVAVPLVFFKFRAVDSHWLYHSPAE